MQRAAAQSNQKNGLGVLKHAPPVVKPAGLTVCFLFLFFLLVSSFPIRLHRESCLSRPEVLPPVFRLVEVPVISSLFVCRLKGGCAISELGPNGLSGSVSRWSGGIGRL